LLYYSTSAAAWSEPWFKTPIHLKPWSELLVSAGLCHQMASRPAAQPVGGARTRSRFAFPFQADQNKREQHVLSPPPPPVATVCRRSRTRHSALRTRRNWWHKRLCRRRSSLFFFLIIVVIYNICSTTVAR